MNIPDGRWIRVQRDGQHVGTIVATGKSANPWNEDPRSGSETAWVHYWFPEDIPDGSGRAERWHGPRTDLIGMRVHYSSWDAWPYEMTLSDARAAFAGGGGIHSMVAALEYARASADRLR